MKKTKKLLACLIAAATMFTMGSTAFAEETGTDLPNDVVTVNISKQYMCTNDKTQSPAETFYLAQEEKSVEDGEATVAPDLIKLSGDENQYVAKAVFSEGGAGTTGMFTVTLPSYEKVGKYSYKLQEVDGKTAGVTYRTDTIKLVVTVINGKNGALIRQVGVHTEKDGVDVKSSSFNDNKYSAGKLKVTKTVEGNLGDKTKKFHFTVKFEKPENKDVKSDITATVAGTDEGSLDLDWTSGSCTYEFDLADGETASLGNIPYDVKYTVTESDYEKDGYSIAMKTGNKGTVSAAEQTASFTNTKTGEIDTGINLTTLPYILVFAGVIVIAGAAFITRRRKYED